MTKTPKVFNVRLSETGRTYPVTLNFTSYVMDNTLAVRLVEARPPWSPFAVITVNLSDRVQDETHAFLDTNNCPWAEEFLRDNGIAEPVDGVTGQSGFCTYPLYKFNLESQWEEQES